MHVSEWMTPSVLTIKPKDSICQARELMTRQRINQLPVVVDDKLRGILTDRDIRDAYPSSTTLVRSKKIDAFAGSHIVEEAMTYRETNEKGERQCQTRHHRLNGRRLVFVFCSAPYWC